MATGLPPIHDAVRLWHANEDTTLQACIAFRKRKRPGWTLAWLRNSAAYIFDGRLKESALRQAIRENVPLDSQKSVLAGLDLLLDAIRKHEWRGKELPPRDVQIGNSSVEVRPVGRYYSNLRQKEFVIALQPRLEEVPSIEQFRIWLSILHHQYCVDEQGLEPLIIDISKNLVNGKRELRELSQVKIPILEINELNERLALVSTCYQRAVEIVPELPARPEPIRDRKQRKLL